MARDDQQADQVAGRCGRGAGEIGVILALAGVPSPVPTELQVTHPADSDAMERMATSSPPSCLSSSGSPAPSTPAPWPAMTPAPGPARPPAPVRPSGHRDDALARVTRNAPEPVMSVGSCWPGLGGRPSRCRRGWSSAALVSQQGCYWVPSYASGVQRTRSWRDCRPAVASYLWQQNRS